MQALMSTLRYSTDVKTQIYVYYKYITVIKLYKLSLSSSFFLIQDLDNPQICWHFQPQLTQNPQTANDIRTSSVRGPAKTLSQMSVMFSPQKYKRRNVWSV